MSKNNKVPNKNKQGILFWSNFTQKLVWSFEFQKFGVSTSKVLWVPIFRQNEQLWIFRPKFWEIVQLREIFWFLQCWGCYKINQVEVDGAGVEVGGDGAGWRWVHGLAIPIKISGKLKKSSKMILKIKQVSLPKCQNLNL